MLSRKKPTHIYATLFHQITVILQISLSIFSQNLSDYSSRLDLAQPEWTSTLESKTLPCFREFVTVHEIIISAPGQVSCVLHVLFPSVQILLLISGMGEAELAAKVQTGSQPVRAVCSHHLTCLSAAVWKASVASAHGSQMPFPPSCLCHTCQEQQKQSPLGDKKHNHPAKEKMIWVHLLFPAPWY